MKSKHTKGVISVTFSEDFSNDYYISPAPTFGERKANAQLIADAFNVTNETGMTPRELQKSHAELLEALKEANELMRNLIDSDIISDESIRVNDFMILSEQAIENATK